MKHKIKSLLMGLLLWAVLICPAFAASSFPDVDEDAAYANAVAYVNEAGIMVGDTQGNFNPNKTVTRAEMATIICRMINEAENLEKSSLFTDLPIGHWANAYVSKAAELGIVSGYGNGKFGPSDNVTYEQAVTMIIRAIGGNDVALEYGGYPNGYIVAAEENGLLEGIRAEKGKALSRSDIAEILYNYYFLSTFADHE